MKLETAPSPKQFVKGRQKTFEAVRQTMVGLALPLATVNNLLGFQADDQGQVPAFTVMKMQGEGQEVRFDLCARFCDFLHGQEYYIQKFDRLLHHQQV